MSEDPKLFDAGDYNLFRYCHNDPMDFTDPMGLDGEATGLLDSGTHDRRWDTAKWFDRSNLIQGNFAWSGTAYQPGGLTMGRTSATAPGGNFVSRLFRIIANLFGHRRAATTAGAAGESGRVYATAYGARDNDPPGDQIARPGLDGARRATLADGSYERPTTLAVSRQWLYGGGDEQGYFVEGDRVHLNGHGWYRVEDYCGACNRRRSIDRWTGDTTALQQRAATGMVNFQVFHPGEPVPRTLLNDPRSADLPY
jgi:hypothetical protein